MLFCDELVSSAIFPGNLSSRRNIVIKRYVTEFKTRQPRKASFVERLSGHKTDA
jgi:hypothetical protein